MRIYLAGPMRGYPENNAAAFRYAAGFLRDLGHVVWSPAEHDASLEPAFQGDMRFYLQRDLPALLQQDAVVLLDGWNRSHGACLERHAADVAGLEVFLLHPGLEQPLVRLAPHDWRWRAERPASSR